MHSKLIDERDAVSEDTAPVFRVALENGSATSTYRLTDGSLPEALAWARQQAAERYAVWLEHTVVDEPGAVALTLLERSDAATAG